MGQPSYMRSVVDRNVVMQRVTVYNADIPFHCTTISLVSQSHTISPTSPVPQPSSVYADSNPTTHTASFHSVTMRQKDTIRQHSPFIHSRSFRSQCFNFLYHSSLYYAPLPCS